MLLSVQNNFPPVYRFVHQCYLEASNLYLGEEIILSQRGVQQGDPLGPALFAFTLQSIVTNINTELNVWYLDDGTIAGDREVVLEALHTIRIQASEI